jgi:hypothetical protein
LAIGLCGGENNDKRRCGRGSRVSSREIAPFLEKGRPKIDALPFSHQQASHKTLAAINFPRCGNVSSIMRAVPVRNTTF